MSERVSKYLFYNISVLKGSTEYEFSYFLFSTYTLNCAAAKQFGFKCKEKARVETMTKSFKIPNVSVPGVVADVSAFIFSIYHFKCNHHRTFMDKE